MCLIYLSDVFFVNYTVLWMNSFENTSVCKSYYMQYCLLAMLDKQKHENDKITSFGALLTYRIDLLTVILAFDCLFPKLLLANLQDFGFSIVALKLLCSYLTNNR